MKKDLTYAFIAGLITGVFLIPTFKNNNIIIPYQNFILLLALPLAALVGIAIAKIIGRYFKVIFQLAKFTLTGVFNASIDFGILNILMVFSGITAGVGYVIFKSVSFIIANLNSYFWNRMWTFEEKGGGEGREYLKFLIVSIIGLLINVGAASFIVNFTNPSFNLNDNQWANIGAAVGSLAGLLWNFLGYKLIVFKK